jgi:hypothetical protein
VLGETIQRYHPTWKFSLCLPDKEPSGFKIDLSNEPFNEVVRIDELGIPDLHRWIFEHDLVELCTAVKGPMLCRLLDVGAKKIIYLDPDIVLFSDISEVGALLDRYDMVLTPHQLEPDQHRQAIVDNEIGSLKHGIYNLGFLAVANTTEGCRFARWWCDRLLEFCFDDIPGGLFTDQRWCDHVPVFFPNTHILRDPGYNVASWNQSQRPITIEKDGSLRAAGRPLRCFHFTKITSVGEVMLKRYSEGRLVVSELIDWYMSRLEANRVAGLPAGWWAYGHYSDGTLIPRAHRLAFRIDPKLRDRFPNPFDSGPGSLSYFFKWGPWRFRALVKDWAPPIVVRWFKRIRGLVVDYSASQPE